MSTFANAVRNQSARTENNMKARVSTSNPVVDLFFKIGASRGQDITPVFTSAYVENKELALRIALWARDVRGGSGERQIFRDIIKYLEVNDKASAIRLLDKAPEVGRWDDLLVVTDAELKQHVFCKVQMALENQNGLAAKWMPRKGALAKELREYLKYSPKRYRKTLVNLTKVVEQQMCAKDWDSINFSHVPSVASSRYKKAFNRHTPKYGEYVKALVENKTVDGKEVKVNASAIFPHDVLKGKINVSHYTYRSQLSYNQTELNLIMKQWEALPNYIGDANVLPLVDVSGSMSSQVSPGVQALDISVSLGLYCADKNKGKFKDTFLTFSGDPELLNLQGNILQKIDQMVRSKWEMNTNLHAAFNKILKVALSNNVPEEEMPQTLLILSDMQFDACASYDDSAIEMIRRKYNDAGYKLPQIVFWNLMARDNVPVKSNEYGVALVSGFSPAILKSVLSADMDHFTPEGVMMKTIMNDRYAC